MFTLKFSLSRKLNAFQRPAAYNSVESVIDYQNCVYATHTHAHTHVHAHTHTSDGKPMQITKEIDDVLWTYGYIADDSSKLVQDSMQFVE